MTRAEQGAALIAAVLVAAVVAAIAVTLTTHDRYAILGVTRLDEQARASELTRELEVQAATALGDDLLDSRHDDTSEAWAQTAYTVSREGFEAVARLQDAQRLFNLNSLAFQPPTATADGAPQDDVPPPAPEGNGENGGGDASAERALRELVPGGDPAIPADRGEETPAEPPSGAPGGTQERSLSPQQVATARFTLLLQALQLPAELVPALLDWLDADSDTRFPNGAEDEYYTRLEQPYRAANGAMADISELRLVRGFTPEIYAKLAPYVSVLGNSVPLNVNTAPAEVLMSIGPGLDRATADLLVTSREIEPWPGVEAFLKHPLLGGRPVVAQGLTTRSNWFELRTRIEGDADTLFRRTLIERLAPNRLRIARRDRLYGDG